MIGILGIAGSDRSTMRGRCHPLSTPLTAGLLILVGSLGLCNSALASFVDPYLTENCSGCQSNGDNLASTSYPTNFGFKLTGQSGSGSIEGDFVVDILVPNNEYTSTASYTISSSNSSETANAPVSTTPWTSSSNQTLSQYLDISLVSGTTSNSFSNFDCNPAASCANAYDPGLTGFYVYQINLGNLTLGSSPNLNFSSSSSSLPPASYIVGFLENNTWKGPNWIATASTSALFYAVAAPEPSSLALLAVAVLSLFLVRRRRRQTV
jgi:hypothetical protein